jgi:TPR repeat protein
VRYDVGEAGALYQLAIAGVCVAVSANLGLCFEKGRGVPLDRAEAERLYQLVARSGSALVLTLTYNGFVDGASARDSPDGMTPAVALEHTRDAVHGLNLAARLGDSAAAECLATLAGRRDVASACCVGCGASRKLKLCKGCRVARFYNTECTARMCAHKASCKAWRKDSGGKTND